MVLVSRYVDFFGNGLYPAELASINNYYISYIESGKGR